MNLTKLSSRSCTVMWEVRQGTLMPEEEAEAEVGEVEEEVVEEEEEVVEVMEEEGEVVVVDSLYLS